MDRYENKSYSKFVQIIQASHSSGYHHFLNKLYNSMDLHGGEIGISDQFHIRLSSLFTPVSVQLGFV